MTETHLACDGGSQPLQGGRLICLRWLGFSLGVWPHDRVSRVGGLVGNGVWETFRMKQLSSWTSKVKVSGRIRFFDAEASWGRLHGLYRLGLASQVSEHFLCWTQSQGKKLSRLLLL